MMSYMDNSALWNLVKKDLKQASTISMTSAEVCDVMGTNRMTTDELSDPQYRNLDADVRFDFRNLTDPYHWEMHFWRSEIPV